MKKLIYILLLVLFSSNTNEDNNKPGLWFSSVTFTRVSKNFYKSEVRIVNISLDSIYIEVPYPHSYDLTASQNYFATRYWGKKITKDYFSHAKKDSDTIGQVVIKNRKDFIVIAPKQKLDLKFDLYCERGYQDVFLCFKYNFIKEKLLAYGQNNNQTESIRLRLNIAK